MITLPPSALGSAAAPWVARMPFALAAGATMPHSITGSTKRQQIPASCSARTPLKATATALADSPAKSRTSVLPQTTIIVGGGPAGLGTAIMLAQLGWSGIKVLERLPPLPLPDAKEWGDPERSYNIGLGHRGQTALAEIGAWEDVLAWSVPVRGRKDWKADGTSAERMNTDRPWTTQVLQRDRLASCLLQHIQANYPNQIMVIFEAECEQVLAWPGEAEHKELGALQVRVGGDEDGRVETMRAELFIGCDGVRSAIRSAMEADPKGMRERSGRPLRVVRYKETNARYIRSVLLRLKGEDWRDDLNYSAQLEGDMTLEALPTKEGVYVGLVLHRPGDKLLAAVTTKDEAKQFFKQHFPQFYDCISDAEFEAFAHRKAGPLPGFRYAGPVLHRGEAAVLLGDAIHVVKPYFGLGANSALEDITVLKQCLVENGLTANSAEQNGSAAKNASKLKGKKDSSSDTTAAALRAALKRFSDVRGKEAKALVQMSRTFDNTGLWGAVTFVGPIIVDSISYRLLPQLFAPNTIAFMQRKGITFTQVRARKRRDRILQLSFLAAFAAVAWKLGSAAISLALLALRATTVRA